MKPDPLGNPRNPLAVYLLLLALVSGVAQLCGLSASATIEAELPGYTEAAWSCLLIGGPSASLAGMYWQGDVRTGLGLKGIGMFTLAVAATIYALVILVALHGGGTLNAGIVFGFGLACFLQYRKINKRIHDIIELSDVM